MTRIAFLVCETGVPVYVSLLRRLLPSYRYAERPIWRLCIYRLDRKELYEVGRMDAKSVNPADTIFVSWLPDGKHVQFLHQGAVYRVSVD